jgi:hypothetical protein
MKIKVKRYEQRDTNSIGTIYNPQLNPALISKAGRFRRAYRRREGAFAAPIMKICGLAHHKGHKRINEAQKRFCRTSSIGMKIA